MLRSRILLGLVFISSIIMAQSDLKIGQWKSHLPHFIGRSITQSETKVYYATEWSLFILDKDRIEQEEYMSTIDGLSDIGMGEIKFVPDYQTLITTYKNSNIDLVKPNSITNLPFLKEDVGIIGDKQIYNIYLADNNLAYLACGFGLIELNVEREEFGFTTIMNVRVNDVVIHEGNFYAATDEGIYKAPNDGITNLQDFGNWELLEGTGFPMDYNSSLVETYDGKLYAEMNDTVFVFEGDVPTYFYFEEGFAPKFMTTEGMHLLLGLSCTNNCTGKVLFFDENLNAIPSGDRCVSRTNFAIEDQNGRVWFSDRWDEIRIADEVGGDCQRKFYKGPYTHHAEEIVVDDGIVFVTTEIPPDNGQYGFYELNEGEWIVYNGLFESKLQGIRSVYRVAVHPENKKVYVGEFYSGLWEKDGDQFVKYDTTNSLLQISIDDTSVARIHIGGLAFDDENNLWMTNHNAGNPIVVLRNDGVWQNNFDISQNQLQDIVVDQAGNKWCAVDGNGVGVIVFNEGDINNPNDDILRPITAAQTELPSNDVKSIAVDLDGDVWVGTAQGVAVFECGSSALDASCRGSRRIVEVDGFNAYLLETESVNTIAVDGANRKWFGTNNGVFVQSPNGEELIAFYDVDNSPLFDNRILDIAVDHESGEVFIGTASGLLSVRGEALGGGTRHENQVYAYPNPVQPDYDGPIAIKGLPRDADVKITDIRGQLIYEGQALGGQAIWDGRDYNGQKAASGVYLVFTTSREQFNTPEAHVTKILFIK